MIHLTRLNGTPIYINNDLIKYAEASPDTMLTLLHGEKIVVLETCDEVAEKINTCRANVLAELSLIRPNALAQVCELNAHQVISMMSETKSQS